MDTMGNGEFAPKNPEGRVFMNLYSRGMLEIAIFGGVRILRVISKSTVFGGFAGCV